MRTLREAAVEVLRSGGPMHYQALMEEIIVKGLASSSSKTPAASLNATIAVDIKRNGTNSEFVRVRPGVYGLRALHAAAAIPDLAPEEREPGGGASDTEEGAKEDAERRGIAPFFPTYREARQLLNIWPGRPRKQLADLEATLVELRGTRQNAVDWTDPDQWIPERLKDADRELADAIWSGSGKTVNPRYSYGHWLLVNKHGLVCEDDSGVLRLTDRGCEFLDNQGGDAETLLDEREGIVGLLALVADLGPTRAGGLIEEWTEYLARHTAVGSDSTIRDTLRRRLNNLLDRELISRKGALYSITDAGLAYLQRVGTDEILGGDEPPQLRMLAKKQEIAVRESLRELLLEMDPFGFEHLIKRLLEEMGYQNVEVTTRSGDGGVDVVADIELGITAVREVVQAKRHKRTIQRKDLDALRGSLYRFSAVRGTIIATAAFSKGTAEAAFATGAAPITLIDCDKLIDLFIEHGIGVKKNKIEYLSLDADVFTECEEEA